MSILKDHNNVAQAPIPKPQLAAPRGFSQFSEYLSHPIFVSFIAGGVAGAVSRTVVSPLERMKIIFQVQGPGSEAYQGVVPTLTKMWREEGWRGFFRGNGTNCIRIVPYSAVQFASYTAFKSLLENHDTSGSTYVRLSAGALAGMTSVFATYPLDIVRTRLSINTATIGGSQVVNRSKPPGMWGTMKYIYQNEGGIRALYRGLIPTTYGVAPYVGLNFAVYESVRGYLTPEGKDSPSTFGKLAAGAVSGTVAQTLTYPFDLLRRRFQVTSVDKLGFHYDSVYGALKNIMLKEGVKGLYKGLSANLLKVVPSMASNWLSFEVTRDFLTRAAQKSTHKLAP